MLLITIRMKLLMQILIITVAFLSGVSAARAEQPAYQLSVKDGSELTSYLATNPWLKELKQSNLYEGFMLRLGPLMGALAKTQMDKKPWTGRLADYMLEVALKNRAVHVYHFNVTKLVHPVGFSVQGLNDIETKALSAIVSATRGAPDQEGISPINIAEQKLAVKLGNGCLAISRDPQVAAWSWERCLREGKLSESARVTVFTSKVAAGVEMALTKYLGVGNRFDIDLRKSANGVVEVVSGKLELTKNHRLRNVAWTKSHLMALPASTYLMSSWALPSPQSASPEGLMQILKAGPETVKSGKYIMATYFHLGSKRLEEGGVVAEMGVLIDQKNSQISSDEWAKIFEPSFNRDVYVKGVCQDQLTLVTPLESVIARIEAACKGEVPTLAQIPAGLQSHLKNNEASQFWLINAGRALAHFVELGWSIDQPDKPEPVEVSEAKKILRKIPAVVLNGQINGNNLLYRAQSGAF